MNPEKFHDAMNYLDDDLIAETDDLRQGGEKKPRFTARKIIPWAACAACLALIVGFGPGLMPAMEANGTASYAEGELESPGEMILDRIYGGAEVCEQNSKSDYVFRSVSCGDLYMEIPETWEYELEPGEDSLFIVIRPANETGCVRVGYWPGFAVCGTGLTVEERVIAGRDARIGTYDGDAVWSFITFGDDYVAINEGADAWWGQYGDLMMKSLETLMIGEGA